MWKEIGCDKELLKQAARWEKAFPPFYRRMTNTERATLADFLKFYDRCDLYALFTNEEFCGLVYLEKVTEDVKSVHLDLKRGTRLDLRDLASIRDAEFRKGTRQVEAWVLDKNRALQRVLASIGFAFTSLRMTDNGFRYLQMTVWQETSCKTNDNKVN